MKFEFDDWRILWVINFCNKTWYLWIVFLWRNKSNSCLDVLLKTWLNGIKKNWIWQLFAFGIVHANLKTSKMHFTTIFYCKPIVLVSKHLPKWALLFVLFWNVLNDSWEPWPIFGNLAIAELSQTMFFGCLARLKRCHSFPELLSHEMLKLHSLK